MSSWITWEKILITAFSGFGVTILSLLFRSYRKKNKRGLVVQRKIKARGDVAGGSIIDKGSSYTSKNEKKQKKITQIKIDAGGDVAGGDIIK